MKRSPWKSEEWDDLGKRWTNADFPDVEIVPWTNHRWGTEHLIGWRVFRNGEQAGHYNYLRDAKTAVEMEVRGS